MRVAVAALAFVCSIAAVAQTPAQPGCDRVAYEISRGQYSRALAQLSGIPAAGRSEADQANLRGLALMLMGDSAKAIESFDLALELQPSLAVARMNRAITRLRAGDYARASADLDPLVRDAASPLRAQAAYHQALALDALGRPAEAEAMLDRALSVKPDLDEALLCAGVLRERRGDLEGAGRAYKSYLDRHPDSLVAMLRFGLTAQRSGHLPAARTWLGRVIARAPESPEAVEARKVLEMWE